MIEPDYEDREQQRLEREEIDPRSNKRYEDFARRAAKTRHKVQTKVPAVGLDPEHWRPRAFSFVPPRDPQVVEYRRLHRPFRSAFRGGMVAGERARRIMGHVGGCHARGLR